MYSTCSSLPLPYTQQIQRILPHSFLLLQLYFLASFHNDKAILASHNIPHITFYLLQQKLSTLQTSSSCCTIEINVKNQGHIDPERGYNLPLYLTNAGILKHISNRQNKTEAINTSTFNQKHNHSSRLNSVFKYTLPSSSQPGLMVKNLSSSNLCNYNYLLLIKNLKKLFPFPF